MKKCLMVIILVMAMAMPCMAADLIRYQVIDSITLDDSPTSVDTTVITNSGYTRAAFFFLLDETDSGNDTSGTITVAYSYDNSAVNIGSVGFVNATAPATIVTSITTNTGASADETVCIFLDDLVAVPYFKATVTITGGAAGGNDQIVVDAYVVLYR